jgi:hypothetical protein
MQDAAQALTGLLAEGVGPEEVLMALEASGYQVSPPAEGGGGMPMAGVDGPPPMGMPMMGPPEDTEEEDPTKKAVSNAFKAHGLK